MENLEFSGKTVEEAIQHALEQLGVSRDEVEVAVVKEGKSGILGFGAEPAVVRVTPLTSKPQGDAAEPAKNILERLLALMEIDGTVTLRTETVAGGAPSVVLNINGDDLSILIGWRGQTLSSLQYLVRLLVSHQTKSRAPIVIDVEDYKQRRNKALEDLARQMAEQVKANGKPFTFEPMSAFERRIIHITLADHPDVTTESMGEGESRKVIILPKQA